MEISLNLNGADTTFTVEPAEKAERGTTITLDPQRLHYDELTITASFHHTPFHFAEALRLLEEGFIDPALLIQERLTLEALPAFFKQAAAGAGPLKAARTPDGA